MDWSLSFTCATSMPTARCEQALSAFAGAPVTTDRGELDGNPRDNYARSASIRCQRGDVQVAVSFTEHLTYVTSEPTITELDVRLSGTSVAAMLDAWTTLREALGAIGCVDRTLRTRGVVRIVKSLDAERAARLREDITAAYVETARTATSVLLVAPYVDDLDRVLAAYERAAEIKSMTLEDCGLRTRPPALARFPNLESLTLIDQGIDGDLLRGLALPRLGILSMPGSSPHHLRRDDLAGFPNLGLMFLQSSRLRELDPAILDVCPRLSRVQLDHTPLARDTAALDALRARWPTVSLDVT
ncbi:MAG TPA: hypothetical protein VFQ53_04525 [Kofleriaceae bacterium]|nr:hypothetical protein [Kofleriaceae bacterium]